MSYLFYVGIIIPTVITIVLFVVFIYCWFLQRARKEVLTKKYDPHGKMRRLGMSLEPPPPPAYCRIDDTSSGSSLLAASGSGGGGGMLTLGGEDNEAYDVSRSPSTEQDARGRGMYHTYHDSGISAGLTGGGFSPSQESEPRQGGFAYRSCPDSGISGFSVQPSSSAACRGCGQAAAGQLTSPQQPLHHLHLGNEIQLHYEEQSNHIYNSPDQPPQHLQYEPNHFQHHPQQQQQHQQQQHLPQAMLHQTMMPASVHPSHGVCYGDDMTHPQSPQHYNPPPVHPSTLSLHPQKQHHQHLQQQHPPQLLPRGAYDERLAYLHPDSPPSATAATMQIRRDLAARRHSPERSMAAAGSLNVHGMQQNDIQLQQVHDFNGLPSYTQAVTQLQEDIAMMREGRDVTATTHHFANDNVGVLNDPSSPMSQFHPQNPPPVQERRYGQHHDAPHAAPTAGSSQQPQAPSSPSKQTTHSYRDSGVSDLGRGAPLASGDRPDSQASQSSTTDSEDSGFRSSHCAAHTSSQLSKQGNPLLKPFRRTRNNANNTARTNKPSSSPSQRGKPARHGSSSNNSDDSSSNGARPLITLNPQNLPQPLGDTDVIHQTTSLFNSPDFGHRHNTNPNTPNSPSSRGLNQNSSVIDPNGIPRTTPGSPLTGLVLANSKGSPVHSNKPTSGGSTQHSPTRDWPPSQSVNDQETMVKQNIDMTDISTHLSWKYLQDISTSSSSSTSPPPSKTSPGTGGGPMLALQSCHQGLAQGPGTDMEVFGFSVV